MVFPLQWRNTHLPPLVLLRHVVHAPLPPTYHFPSSSRAASILSAIHKGINQRPKQKWEGRGSKSKGSARRDHDTSNGRRGYGKGGRGYGDDLMSKDDFRAAFTGGPPMQRGMKDRQQGKKGKRDEPYERTGPLTRAGRFYDLNDKFANRSFGKAMLRADMTEVARDYIAEKLQEQKGEQGAATESIERSGDQPSRDWSSSRPERPWRDERGGEGGRGRGGGGRGRGGRGERGGRGGRGEGERRGEPWADRSASVPGRFGGQYSREERGGRASGHYSREDRGGRMNGQYSREDRGGSSTPPSWNEGPTGRGIVPRGPREGFDRYSSASRSDRTPPTFHSDKYPPRSLNSSSNGYSYLRRNDQADDSHDGSVASAHEPTSPGSKPDRYPVSIDYTTAASQFIYGRSAVWAALHHNRRKLYKLYLLEQPNQPKKKQFVEKHLLDLARRRFVVIRLVAEQWLLDKMSKGRPHNGLVLEASDLPRPKVKSLGAVTRREETKSVRIDVDRCAETKEEAAINGTDAFIEVNLQKSARRAWRRNPLVLVLDQIVDPVNVGSLIRSAAFLGVTAVGITTHQSAPITSVALKTASGAAEAMPVFTVATDTAKFVQESRRAGWNTFAAVTPPTHVVAKRMRKSGRTVSLDSLMRSPPLAKGPCMLVLGNEGWGLDNNVRMAVDKEVYIDGAAGKGTLDSLNVNVAGAIICSWMTRVWSETSTEEGGAAATEEEGGEEEEEEEAGTDSESDEKLAEEIKSMDIEDLPELEAEEVAEIDREVEGSDRLF